jgi:hypothetical protein
VEDFGDTVLIIGRVEFTVKGRNVHLISVSPTVSIVTLSIVKSNSQLPLSSFGLGILVSPDGDGNGYFLTTENNSVALLEQILTDVYPSLLGYSMSDTQLVLT